MNLEKIRQYIYVIVALSCLWVSSVCQHTAVAQSSATRHYEVGDVYVFPDGSKGVVCYVDPNNPHKGWAVAITDLVNDKTLFAISETYQIEDLTASLGLKTVTNFNSWGHMLDWHDHGYENTRKLYEANIFPTNLHNALDFGNGWYIPDAQQLRLWFALIPFFIQKNIYGFVIPNKDEYSNNAQDSYWSSTVLAPSTYTLNQTRWGLACLNLATGMITIKQNNDNNSPVSLAVARRIRAVREFDLESPVAYWLYPDATNRSASIKVKNLHEITVEVARENPIHKVRE